MSELREVFKNKAFIPFITCGYPDLKTTEEIIYAMADSGADLIELGIPFSDPTAEGVVIQEASKVALNNGVSTDKIFELIHKVRKRTNVALAFMTYGNVVFSYGNDRFLQNAKDCGISALILPDVPFEEKGEFEPDCQKYGIDFISFISPTSKQRVKMIAKEAKGFIYCISSLGVTGVRQSFHTNIKDTITLAKANSDIPIAVGFGVQTPQQASEVCEYADGVIIGSAIVKMCAQYGKDAPKYIAEFVKSIKQAIS